MSVHAGSTLDSLEATPASTSPSPLPGADRRVRRQRFVIAAAVLVAYIGAGLALRLDANTYLLLSLPVTLAFQIFLRRKPIRSLWLFDAPPFRLDRGWWALFIVFAAYPLVTGVQSLQEQDWGSAAYLLTAAAGAAPFAYSLRGFNRDTPRYLWQCLATAGAIGVGLVVVGALIRWDPPSLPQPIPLGSLRVFAISMLQYLPITFLVEEVLFRGAIDPYLHETDTGRGTLSAYYVSGLWAVWHLPFTLAVAGPAGIPALAVHLVIGPPLSMAVRRSRNLAVPGITHSIISAARNALT